MFYYYLRIKSRFIFCYILLCFLSYFISMLYFYKFYYVLLLFINYYKLLLNLISIKLRTRLIFSQKMKKYFNIKFTSNKIRNERKINFNETNVNLIRCHLKCPSVK